MLIDEMHRNGAAYFPEAVMCEAIKIENNFFRLLNVVVALKATVLKVLTFMLAHLPTASQ